MSVMRRECTHLDQINDVEPSAEGCEECLQMGDTWVHLRECLICGHVGCWTAPYRISYATASGSGPPSPPPGRQPTLSA